MLLRECDASLKIIIYRCEVIYVLCVLYVRYAVFVKFIVWCKDSMIVVEWKHTIRVSDRVWWTRYGAGVERGRVANG